MRKLLVCILSCVLIACSSFTKNHYEPICFETQEEASQLGGLISDNGFFPRVSYWVTGDSQNSIPGVGLKWDGFDPRDFCPNGGDPIVAFYESEKSDFDPELVMRWSRAVLKAMIREQSAKTNV